MHLWHSNLEFWFTLDPCCQISRFMLMWRVQGGLSLPAVSRERRVMQPSSLPIHRKPPPHPPFPHLTEAFVLEFVVREAKRQASGRGDRGVKSASRLECCAATTGRSPYDEGSLPQRSWWKCRMKARVRRKGEPPPDYSKRLQGPILVVFHSVYR